MIVLKYYSVLLTMLMNQKQRYFYIFYHNLLECLCLDYWWVCRIHS